jgi:PEGA domain
VESPGDRIVRELEQLPHRERMGVVAKVLERMGMTKPPPSEAVRASRRVSVAGGTILLSIVLGAWFYTSTHAHGRLELTTEPSEATVFIDGNQVHEQPRSSLRLKRGPHTLSVTMPGYARSDQNIVITPDQALRLAVKLEPSHATGFLITSDPPGMSVWLDGERMMATSGPALTDFRAVRIPPGAHLLELKEEGRRLYWRKAVLIEPDEMTRVHAVMAPNSERGLF